jgi:hypothetical protein
MCRDCLGLQYAVDYIDRWCFAENRRADLWRGQIGLAKDGLPQQEDAGEEKENGDQAEGGGGCGHG